MNEGLIAEPSFNIIHPHRELNIVASPGLRLGWEISDAKTGRVEQKGSQEGRSFTKQFLQLLYAMMSMENETLKHDNGSNYAMNWDSNGAYVMRYYSMDIGSSAQAVNFADYNLISPIGNGTDSGQMQYGSITHTAPNYDESRVWNRETRSFTNNSGANVTINELGHRVYSGASGYKSVLIMRDVTGGIVVPTTKVITFNYDMESQKGTGWTFLQEFFTRLYNYLRYTDSDKYYPTLRVLTPPYGNFVNAGSTQYDQYRYNYNILSGIELGTLNSAIEVTQTATGGLIAHGKGEGQLESYGTFVESPTYDATSGQFDIVKHFKNSSGASINVYQVGLRCLYSYSTTDNKLIFCKLLSSPFVIPDGSYAEVRITMKVEV